MNILGISNLQNSSAVLISNSRLAAGAEEERFTRIKHYQGFPYKSIEYCLKQANLTINDIDYIAVGWNPLSGLWTRCYETLRISLRNKDVGGKLKRGSGYFSIIKDQLSINTLLEERFPLKVKIPVRFFNHHRSHAACCSYLSPFTENAYLIADGTGEFQTITLGYRKKNDFNDLIRIKYPYSLGHLYSIFTAFLGFRPNNGEGKVMGLAAYGKPTFYDEIINLINYNFDKGIFTYDTSFFDYTEALSGNYNKHFLSKFDEPRKPESEIKTIHCNLAASIQRVAEYVLINACDSLYRKTEAKNLGISGGVALNCLANAKIIEKTGFRNFFVPSAPNDAGVSLGAALLCASPDSFETGNLCDPFLGPDFSDEEIKNAMENNNITQYKYLNDIAKMCALILGKGKISGWFQGRMEFGPRALGNRSIFTLPTPVNQKDILNNEVKFRESFRPFAPVVRDDYFAKITEITPPESPYMSFALPIKESYIRKMEAVVHVNGRSRLQSASRQNHPLLYNLLNEVETRTGLPILLNTSFNIRGEPIVCTPDDAINCYLKTGLDCLFIGNYFLYKDKKLIELLEKDFV